MDTHTLQSRQNLLRGHVMTLKLFCLLFKKEARDETGKNGFFSGKNWGRFEQKRERKRHRPTEMHNIKETPCWTALMVQQDWYHHDCNINKLDRFKAKNIFHVNNKRSSLFRIQLNKRSYLNYNAESGPPVIRDRSMHRLISNDWRTQLSFLRSNNKME